MNQEDPSVGDLERRNEGQISRVPKPGIRECYFVSLQSERFHNYLQFFALA